VAQTVPSVREGAPAAPGTLLREIIGESPQQLNSERRQKRKKTAAK
jgi:hypothetical protein